MRLLYISLILTGVIYGEAPVGIPRELAVERAREISDVAYDLHFTLEPHASKVAGRERLQFHLDRARPLLLDFREGAASNLVLNGSPAPIHSENGHILLPQAALRAGANELSLDFTALVAPAGAAITRYEDKDDGSEYIYTLFVPMDASMAFPCFDQPDLKGKFTLTLTAPAGWTTIANTAQQRSETAGAAVSHYFAQTLPISTYLFAFAAGPFENLHATPGLPNVYVRRSQAKRAEPEIPAIQSITAAGLKFFGDYFAQPYPFPKYEMVLIPGFPYGGMEHAGATFLNEDSMLFRSAPTADDRFRRDVTVLHELAHQWFGDFTTMRWFDDLWLKEGFAQYMAFRALAGLEPGRDVWAKFYSSIKPAAYGIDVTKGTTPIYQDIPNLKDAKSAYGAIVYSKAPGLLRQLAFLVGETQFRDGLRDYLHAHAYGNATWSDLVHALEKSSGLDLEPWAQAWIRRRGVPVIETTWSCGAEKLTSVTLKQHDALGEGGIWPIATEVLLGYADSPGVRVRTQLNGATATVAGAAGKPCPSFVFANDEDHAYGVFLPDAKTRAYISDHIGAISDTFERTLLWGALWDAVRFTEMPPRDFLATALRELPRERDESLVRVLGARSATALHRYVDPNVRSQLAPQFESLAIDRMLHSDTQGLRILWFRTLDSMASTPSAMGALKDLLNGKTEIPGVRLRSLDRWRMVTTLVAHGDPQAATIYEDEKKRDQTGFGLESSYVAGAAKPDAATKKWYFDDYLHNRERQEDWISRSLSAFNEWNQSELTEPYLRPALEALPQMKRERKIFFVVAWLTAFIDGQQSPAADRAVHGWLAQAHIDPDLRLKVLQAVDELDRTVEIRRRFQ